MPHNPATESAHGSESAVRVRPSYEDINVTVLVMVGLVSTIVTFLIIVTVQGLAYRMESSFLRDAGSVYTMETAEQIRQEAMKAQKELLLGGSAAGAAKVPIDEAMKRVVERYSAGRKPAAAQKTEGTPTGQPAGDGH